jgi:nicotinamidase-related amidase
MSALDLGRRPALVIVDMQNGFCDADGHRAAIGLDHASAAAAIAPIARVLEASRAAALPVFHTRYALRPDYSDAGLLLDKWPGIRAVRGLIDGTRATDIVAALAPAAGERVVTKTRQSAFHGTALEAELRELGVDTLIVCGTTTNMCVGSTVRDAFARDLRAVVPADGTAAPTAEMHERGLADIAYGYGTVTDVDTIVNTLTTTIGRAA